MKIHWKPQSKQAIVLSRTEFEIFFGGSRGGGKTDAGIAWLLYDKDHPRYRALVIRRNADDLRDWIDRASWMYKPTGAKRVGNPPEFKFPSGAVIRTGHLKDEQAYTKYLGHEYQKMLIEELTLISREENYKKLISSCRSSIPEIKPQVFCTGNPLEAGHYWVKDRWRIPDYPDRDKIYSFFDEKEGRDRVFIPATVDDNPKLIEINPEYVKFLDGLEGELKDAWRHGYWTGPRPEGAYYTNQLKRAREEGRIGNVPYEEDLPVYTWWDLGVSDTTAIGFFQKVGQEWHLFDYYEASGEGLSHYAQILQEKGYVYGGHFAPHDIRVRELGSGKSRLEMAKSLGIDFEIVPNLHINDGINAVRMRFNTLWIDEKRCVQFLKAIALYRKEWNEKMGEFKPKPLHDWTSHAADMLRYWAVTNFEENEEEAEVYLPNWQELRG